jgi:hypothetical protein
MWNPFKQHQEEHNEVAWLLAELTLSLVTLSESVKELREEVDYLVDFLDD